MDFESKLVAALEADIAANRLLLPSLPEVAMEICRTASRPDVSFSELAAAVARDPGLSARLIKVANSAMLRGARPIEDIRGAVQRLGLRLVSSLVNSLAIIQSFSFGGPDMQARLRGISEHSLDVAALSHAITAETTGLRADEALLAGLIHDVGKLPMLRRAQELHAGRQLSRATCMRVHPWVGAKVLESWRFPAELVAVAAEHENVLRDSGTDVDYVDVVIVANVHIHRGTADDPYRHIAWKSIPAVRKLGLCEGLPDALLERYETSREMLRIR